MIHHGRGEGQGERAKVAELWKEPFRVWYPGGKDDPRLVLIAVRPQEGEYWDNEGTNKIKYLFEAVKAYTTGRTLEVAEGEPHGHVPL